MRSKPYRDLHRGPPLNLSERSIDRVLAEEFEP